MGRSVSRRAHLMAHGLSPRARLDGSGSQRLTEDSRAHSSYRLTRGHVGLGSARRLLAVVVGALVALEAAPLVVEEEARLHALDGRVLLLDLFVLFRGDGLAILVRPVAGKRPSNLYMGDEE